jgi:hypothetical protein
MASASEGAFFTSRYSFVSSILSFIETSPVWLRSTLYTYFYFSVSSTRIAHFIRFKVLKQPTLPQQSRGRVNGNPLSLRKKFYLAVALILQRENTYHSCLFSVV